MYYFILFLTLFSLPLFTQEPIQLRVELTAQSPLRSAYLGEMIPKESAYSKDYLQELVKVLHFDLSHGGFIQVQSKKEATEALLQSDSACFDLKRWKQEGADFVFRTQALGDGLTLQIYSVKTQSLKTFTELKLTGDLVGDRKVIHRLADKIHLALFGISGIASDKILFSHQTGGTQKDWRAEIWECESDGDGLRQVTFDKSYAVSPIFIAKYQKVLYVTYKLGQPKIFSVPYRGGNGQRAIDLRGNQFVPTHSKSKNTIAFISDAMGRADLFLQTFHPVDNSVEKPIQLFAKAGTTQGSPTFSPDGQRIAFVSDLDGKPRIYLISSKKEATRDTPVMLTKKSQECTCPNWSPDGKKIAYSAKTGKERQIWIYDFETEQEIQLTMGPGNKENPVWAKDSLHLVFNSTDPSGSELYLVNLNQPECIQITKGPGNKNYPNWVSNN